MSLWALNALTLLLLFRRSLIAAWREPVLKFPVLIIESDDWGPGPAHHAAALLRLTDYLAAQRDARGHPAVMTLGLTLSVPDAAAIAANSMRDYADLWLDAAPFEAHLKAILQGHDLGVFALQLHGAAHYWPPTLMQAASMQPAVRNWLISSNSLETEALPSPLQSRWIDASTLPATALPTDTIHAAVAAEVAAYQRIFGESPRAAVPPTFIWNQDVERAWAAAGIRCVITPGRRFDTRDHAGRPSGPTMPISNGERGEGKVIYLVRDDYFEPAKGHTADHALSALTTKTRQGRPCLLETHRFNFTGAQADSALLQLEHLLTQALVEFPGLHFVSSAELAEQYRDRGEWLERRFSLRYRAWLVRLQGLPRFWKLARLSGLALLLSIPTWAGHA
jgi:hypothetical protein